MRPHIENVNLTMQRDETITFPLGLALGQLTKRIAKVDISILDRSNGSIEIADYSVNGSSDEPLLSSHDGRVTLNPAANFSISYRIPAGTNEIRWTCLFTIDKGVSRGSNSIDIVIGRLSDSLNH